MQTVDILYSYYYDKNGNAPTIGGVQTYISRLVELVQKLGGNCRIFQFAETDFEKDIGPKTKLVGVAVSGSHKKKCFQVIERALETRGEGSYLTLYASDTYVVKKAENSIAIQHGIFWDMPVNGKRSVLKSLLGKMRFSYNTLSRISKVDRLVCVDYNFINWYRTQKWNEGVDLVPILNFTDIVPLKEKTHSDLVSIVFARRFFEYRGTRVFATAAQKLLKEFDNIRITFAGDGPDESYLKEIFEGDERVMFTKYSSGESIEFHGKHDIAVVPTTGSEGTSLSLLEAMSAGCAVVCTDVGGMTNIVLNGYNGLMVSAGNDEKLYSAIKELILNREKRLLIAEKGRETVEAAFSFERWEKEWTKLLDDMFFDEDELH